MISVSLWARLKWLRVNLLASVVGLIFLTFSAVDVSAQTSATTSAIGIYAVKVPGKAAGEAQSRTYFGLQLLPKMTFSGLASSISGDVLKLGSIDHSSLGTPQRTNYLHVITGDGRGFIADIVEFGPSSIRCAKNLTDWITPGTRVLIRPHSTLADVFGAANRFGLSAGLSAETADNVVAWDPDAQAERVYYFHSSRGRWEEKEIAADAGNAVLRFPYGIYIIRRSAGTLRIALSGEVGSDPLLLPVRPGSNAFSLPVNLSGSLSGLISSEGAYPVIAAASARTADLLIFEESSTGLHRGPYYFSKRTGHEGWRAVGDEAAIPSLDFLSTLVLRRTGSAGYLRAEGSLVPNPNAPVLSPDPEAGETPLTGEIEIPSNLPASITLQVETSPDLQSWKAYATPTISGNRARFQVPAGQSRAFYRLKITLNP